MTLAAYLRVSDASQVERYSLPAQRDMILAWCEREGLPEPRWYVEEGRSALSDDYEKRPQFLALLTDAEARRVRRIVVVDIDRFARSVIGGLSAAARLEPIRSSTLTTVVILRPSESSIGMRSHYGGAVCRARG